MHLQLLQNQLTDAQAREILETIDLLNNTFTHSVENDLLPLVQDQMGVTAGYVYEFVSSQSASRIVESCNELVGMLQAVQTQAEDRVNQVAGRALENILVALGIAVIIAILLTFLVSRVITRPIVQVATYSQAVALPWWPKKCASWPSNRQPLPARLAI